ncbi:MAG: MucBP domain-containing protein, partial [Clostridia bacterium]|nr:MucBP domain-containing protein [Clostridia bacterium]
MKGFLNGTKRVAAWAIALVMALLPLAGLADVRGDLSIGLQWGDGEATWASRVSYDGYQDCYWAQVPEEALGSLTLLISDPSGAYGSFVPGNGEMVAVAGDAGSSLSSQPMSIDVYEAQGGYAGTVYLYVSSVAAYPDSPQQVVVETPVPPVEPVNVIVHYVDIETGAPVATDTVQAVAEGTWAVTAQPTDLQAYYNLEGDNAQNVTVTRDGADRSEVTFYYRQAPVEPVNVTVHYVDIETGAPVATDTVQAVAEGTW